MDLRGLRYFVEVADSGSFSQAAARLHRTQPAVSRCVAELEAELGVRLFDRAGRRISVTSSGRALLARARLVLSGVDAFSEHARLLASGKSALLRIGAVSIVIERILPEVLRRFRERHPAVEVQLQPAGGTDLLAVLERGDVDLAVGRYARTAVFDAMPAFPFYVLAAVPRQHRLARLATVTAADLAEERLLIAPHSMMSRSLFDTACRDVGVRPRVALESSEFNALMALAQTGQGVAIVPSTAVTEDGPLKLLPVVRKGKVLGSWAAMVWDRRKPLSDHAKAFATQACAYLRRHHPGRFLKLPKVELRAEDPGAL